MNCAEFDLQLTGYVDGVLNSAERQAADAHAASCPACAELLRDVTLAVAFMERAAEVTPPPELVTRLAYLAPLGRVRDEGEYRGVLSRLFGRWFQPVLRPRFAMGMAMTILSFAMLGRCTGIQLQQIRPADLNPVRIWSGVEDKAYRGWDRTVKYYENLRLVYELETRLKEIREQPDAAQGTSAPSQNGAAAPRNTQQGGQAQ